jgi:hypothetical protein
VLQGIESRASCMPGKLSQPRFFHFLTLSEKLTKATCAVSSLGGNIAHRHKQRWTHRKKHTHTHTHTHMFRSFTDSFTAQTPILDTIKSIPGLNQTTIKLALDFVFRVLCERSLITYRFW